jgi:acyl carrier protein
MNKLELFNELIKVVTPVNSKNAHADSLDDYLVDTGLDSLDLLMMGIFLSDIYGVPEEIAKQAEPKTVGEMIDYMEQHKTKEPPATVQEAIAQVS